MAAASRARPEDFFSPDEWRELTTRSRWRGLWLVLHCWGVIGLAMLAGVLWPVTLPLGVLVVGARQLGLFILMHDAAHGLLHPDRRVNDTVARWFCSSSLNEYRPYHLQHHRYVQQAEDPDLPLSAPFPISRVSLRRKLLRDLSGQTFFKQRLGPLLDSARSRRAPGAPLVQQSQELVRGQRFLIGSNSEHVPDNGIWQRRTIFRASLSLSFAARVRQIESRQNVLCTPAGVSMVRLTVVGVR